MNQFFFSIIFSEVIKNNTHDFLLLKTCLQSLSKFSLEKPNNSSINELLENLIIKLKLSTNGYVHGAIGNYYLHNKKVCIISATNCTI